MSKTVRHQRGTLSAIRMESLSAIAGIRSMRISRGVVCGFAQHLMSRFG